MRGYITLLALAIASGLFGSSELVDQAVEEAKVQHQERAFTLFLEALETPCVGGKESDPKEEVLYQEALELYLNSDGKRPDLVAEQVLETYEPITQNRQEYTKLNFLTAMAYANTKQYVLFFSEFYRSYQDHPDHYLVDKARSILSLRLMERARLPLERERLRKQVIVHLKAAVNKYAGDLMLNRMILSLGRSEERVGIIKNSLSQILEQNIRIPRSDVFLYVKDAAAVGEYEIAQSLIDRALSWYRYSRAINAAQKYLDLRRSKNDHS
jgi:hypothetical protein